MTTVRWKYILLPVVAGFVAWKVAANLRRPAKVITGCEARGDGDKPYLTRRTLLGLGPLGKVCLHAFHRSDHDVFHDHPFPFATLVLRGGYLDVTPGTGGPKSEWLGPGAFRLRPARHAHQVVLIRTSTWDMSGPVPREIAGDVPATTLVWLGTRVREWGFHLTEGWMHWRRYFAREGC